MKTISFITLGCRSNQAETDEMKEAAVTKGCTIVEKASKADITVINTCTVTALADKKSRQAIRSALKNGGKVIVTGCIAETDKEQIANIDPNIIIVPNDDKHNLQAYLPSSPLSTFDLGLSTDKVRANLLIQTGCNNYCTYCIVPYARGREKSRNFDECLKRAQNLVESGVKEIVLTGTNVGAFDRLIELINNISGNGERLTVNGKQAERLRLSSIEPNYISNDLIKTIATNKKVCRFLHIPLQSGDDGVLAKMGRKYTSKEYFDLICSIREKIPGIAISTDIIVGFPGETEEQFNNTAEFAKRTGFSRIHAFRYSKRKGTPSAEMKGHLDPKVIAKRASVMQNIRNGLMLSCHNGHIGQTVEALIEQRDKKTGLLEGLTDGFVRILTEGDNDLIGRIVPVSIQKAEVEVIEGKILS